MMKIKGITLEDFVNYKEPCMFIAMPTCTWKCCKDNPSICQNSSLSKAETKEVSVQYIINIYRNNPICRGVVFGGLEPLDSFEELIEFISEFRDNYPDDFIIIYTGYNEDEVEDIIRSLKSFHNIIVKFGRYVPGHKSHYDEILGVNLASNNQYAVRIS